MKFITTSLIFLFFASTIFAQKFATVISSDNIAWLRDFTVITTEGDTIFGKKLSSYSEANGRLKAFALKDEEGTKHKFNSNNVVSVVAKLTKFGKAATIGDNATKSIQSAVTTDYAGIVEQNLVRFNSVVYNKKGKKAILQLVNYGFDQKLKIYPDPNSESGITTINDVAVSGGILKDYFIVKGEQTFKVNKKTYKKLFDTIYDNCSELDNNPKSVSITNICEDVLQFNALCK